MTDDIVRRLAQEIYVLMFGNIAMDATPDVLKGIQKLLREGLKAEYKRGWDDRRTGRVADYEI